MWPCLDKIVSGEYCTFKIKLGLLGSIYLFLKKKIFFFFCNVKDPPNNYLPDLEIVSSRVPYTVMEPSHKLLTLFSSNLGRVKMLLYLLLWVWTLINYLPVVLWAMETTQVTSEWRARDARLSYGHPSLGRVLEVINKNNKIIFFVLTEVITNIFGIQLTTLGKKTR